MINKVFFCYFMLLAPILVKAQLKEIQLINSETAEPIPKASILLIGENNGTVSDENGRVSIGHVKSKQIRVSHLNYENLLIDLTTLVKETTIFKMKPRDAKRIDVVVVSAGFDKLLLGKWSLKKTAIIYRSKNGREHIRPINYKTGNSKEYKSDQTFVISSPNGELQLSGTYIALNNQIQEQVTDAVMPKLKGFKNILFYSRTNKPDQIRIKYKIPDTSSIKEEIWERIKD